VFLEDDPYVGIDIDDCFQDGSLAPVAKKLAKQLSSYTEYSPSGNGLHIIVRAELPQGISHKRDMSEYGFKMLEIYDRARYFTMTGRVYGEANSIREVDLAEIELPKPNRGNIILGTGALRAEDEYLIKQIRGEKDGLAFSRLYDHGDCSIYGGDQSKADLALIGIISK
jgi:putative DNA primase/helicase